MSHVHTASRGVIARFFEHLPVSDRTPIVTLHEGSTPLLRSDRLSREVGAEVFLKYEGLNPTGSFKDRGMTVAISKALEQGARAVVCASTGNTAASAAAYAGRADMGCGVVIPRGHVALGKLAQAVAHGATVVEVEGSFDTALRMTQQLAQSQEVTLVNSINPYRIEGQKTAAFEIVEQLGNAPDLHFMPVGNAGNITAYWRGYKEVQGTGSTGSLPRMFGWQAAGADPIVRGQVVEAPETIATAIRIGNPASWSGAVAAAEESDGSIRSVTDDEILQAYRDLAREGVFVEPASAASVAGLRRADRDGQVERDSIVVCVLTGHGLKDPDRAVAEAGVRAAPARSVEDVASALGLP